VRGGSNVRQRNHWSVAEAEDSDDVAGREDMIEDVEVTRDRLLPLGPENGISKVDRDQCRKCGKTCH
jgi:hypothetical protein